LYVLGISNNDTVIPRGYNEEDLGNLNQCVLTTGKIEINDRDIIANETGRR
jgi:hypothetical protein